VSEATRSRPVDPQILELLRAVSTATLSTQLYRRGFRNVFMHDVRPVRPDLRLVGQAFTLRYIPVREDLEPTGEFDNRTNKQRLAVESVGPGDVLVIDARGDTRAGVLGHILATRLKARGAAGIVTDGAFRDTPGIRELGIPAYARGQNANLSISVHHPADLGVPIACGGVAVLPGDVIVGDGEGVIVIPRAIVEEVARAAHEQEQLEAFIARKVASGASIHGVYPPDQATIAEYEAFRREHDSGAPAR
jgi:regulator of RNase E activity RraA